MPTSYNSCSSSHSSFNPCLSVSIIKIYPKIVCFRYQIYIFCNKQVRAWFGLQHNSDRSLNHYNQQSHDGNFRFLTFGFVSPWESPTQRSWSQPAWIFAVIWNCRFRFRSNNHDFRYDTDSVNLVGSWICIFVPSVSHPEIVQSV